MFDPTLRLLSDADEPLLVKMLLPHFNYPADTPVVKLDAKLPIVSLEADAIYRIEAEQPFLLHLEFESSWQEGRARRFDMYNSLAERRENLLVRTVVILLRPQAQSTDLTGHFVQGFPGEPPYREFRYDVVRLWEIPPHEFLDGGKGLWPLAPLSNVPEDDLLALILQLRDRWKQLPEPQAAELENATFILMGLRYSEQLIEQIYQGVKQMEDSITYQMILNKGKNEGLITGRQEGRQEGQIQMGHVALISVLEGRFSVVSPSLQEAIQHITDINRLSRMLKAVHQTTTPDDILNIQ